MMKAAAALSAFVKGEISPASLVAELEPSVVLSTEPDGATRVDYAGSQIPHVTFSRSDVVRVLDRAIEGEIPLDDVSGWANLMTLLDFFDLDPSDRQSDDVWDALDRMAHPEQSGLDEAWRLRELREAL